MATQSNHTIKPLDWLLLLLKFPGMLTKPTTLKKTIGDQSYLKENNVPYPTEKALFCGTARYASLIDGTHNIPSCCGRPVMAYVMGESLAPSHVEL